MFGVISSIQNLHKQAYKVAQPKLSAQQSPSNDEILMAQLNQLTPC